MSVQPGKPTWEEWFKLDSNLWEESELVTDAWSWWYTTGYFANLDSYQSYTKCPDEILVEMVLRHGDIKLYLERNDIMDFGNDFADDVNLNSDIDPNIDDE